MTFMCTVSIVESQNTAFIGCLHMRQNECEIALNNFAGLINPNLLAKYADPFTASKSGLIAGFL